jgi:aconitase A
MVAAVAISGRLDFNPITDTLTNEAGEQVKLMNLKVRTSSKRICCR